jgi:DNA-binding CsgD family transcriptional regulator/DNA-directed RNA polymerase specialized sigma subunit
MPKFLIRFVALLLVSCLVLDPSANALARAFQNNSLSPVRENLPAGQAGAWVRGTTVPSAVQSAFKQQALAETLLSHPLLHKGVAFVWRLLKPFASRESYKALWHLNPKTANDIALARSLAIPALGWRLGAAAVWLPVWGGFVYLRPTSIIRWLIFFGDAYYQVLWIVGIVRAWARAEMRYIHNRAKGSAPAAPPSTSSNLGNKIKGLVDRWLVELFELELRPYPFGIEIPRAELVAEAIGDLLERSKHGEAIPLNIYDGEFKARTDRAVMACARHESANKVAKVLDAEHIRIIPITENNTRPELPWHALVYLDGDTVVIHEAFLQWLERYTQNSEEDFVRYLADVLGHENSERVLPGQPTATHDEAQRLFPLTRELEIAVLLQVFVQEQARKPGKQQEASPLIVQLMDWVWEHRLNIGIPLMPLFNPKTGELQNGLGLYVNGRPCLGLCVLEATDLLEIKSFLPAPAKARPADTPTIPPPTLEPAPAEAQPSPAPEAPKLAPKPVPGPTSFRGTSAEMRARSLLGSLGIAENEIGRLTRLKASDLLRLRGVAHKTVQSVEGLLAASPGAPHFRPEGEPREIDQLRLFPLDNVIISIYAGDTIDEVRLWVGQRHPDFEKIIPDFSKIQDRLRTSLESYDQLHGPRPTGPMPPSVAPTDKKESGAAPPAAATTAAMASARSKLENQPDWGATLERIFMLHDLGGGGRIALGPLFKDLSEVVGRHRAREVVTRWLEGFGYRVDQDGTLVPIRPDAELPAFIDSKLPGDIGVGAAEVPSKKLAAAGRDVSGRAVPAPPQKQRPGARQARVSARPVPAPRAGVGGQAERSGPASTAEASSGKSRPRRASDSTEVIDEAAKDLKENPWSEELWTGFLRLIDPKLRAYLHYPMRDPAVREGDQMAELHRALVELVREWDPRRRVSFLNFAEERLHGVPLDQSRQLIRYSRRVLRIARELLRTYPADALPTARRIKRKFRISLKTAQRALLEAREGGGQGAKTKILSLTDIPPDTYPPDTHPAPVDQAIWNELWERVERLFKKDQRLLQILTLYFVDEFTMEEIAQQVPSELDLREHISQPRVSQWIVAALRKIRASLGLDPNLPLDLHPGHHRSPETRLERGKAKLKTRAAAPPAQLTEDERVCLQLYLQKLTKVAMADKLGVRVGAVRRMITSIRQKLGLPPWLRRTKLLQKLRSEKGLVPGLTVPDEVMKLTPRECEILGLYGQGLQQNEIAQKLEMQEDAVRQAMLRIRGKLLPEKPGVQTKPHRGGVLRLIYAKEGLVPGLAMPDELIDAIVAVVENRMETKDKNLVSSAARGQDSPQELAESSGMAVRTIQSHIFLMDGLLQDAVELREFRRRGWKVDFWLAAVAVMLYQRRQKPPAPTTPADASTAEGSDSRGISGLPNYIYSPPIFDAIQSGEFALLHYVGGPTIFQRARFLKGEEGRIFEAKDHLTHAELERCRSVVRGSEKLQAMLRSSPDSLFIFAKDLDSKVRADALRKGLVSEDEIVYGSHYSLARPQFIFDRELPQKSPSEISQHFTHEVEERGIVYRGLEARGWIKPEQALPPPGKRNRELQLDIVQLARQAHDQIAQRPHAKDRISSEEELQQQEAVNYALQARSRSTELAAPRGRGVSSDVHRKMQEEEGRIRSATESAAAASLAADGLSMQWNETDINRVVKTLFTRLAKEGPGSKAAADILRLLADSKKTAEKDAFFIAFSVVSRSAVISLLHVNPGVREASVRLLSELLDLYGDSVVKVERYNHTEKELRGAVSVFRKLVSWLYLLRDRRDAETYVDGRFKELYKAEDLDESPASYRDGILARLLRHVPRGPAASSTASYLKQMLERLRSPRLRREEQDAIRPLITVLFNLGDVAPPAETNKKPGGGLGAKSVWSAAGSLLGGWIARAGLIHVLERAGLRAEAAHHLALLIVGAGSLFFLWQMGRLLRVTRDNGLSWWAELGSRDWLLDPALRGLSPEVTDIRPLDAAVIRGHEKFAHVLSRFLLRQMEASWRWPALIQFPIFLLSVVTMGVEEACVSWIVDPAVTMAALLGWQIQVVKKTPAQEFVVLGLFERWRVIEFLRSMDQRPDVRFQQQPMQRIPRVQPPRHIWVDIGEEKFELVLPQEDRPEKPLPPHWDLRLSPFMRSTTPEGRTVFWIPWEFQLAVVGAELSAEAVRKGLGPCPLHGDSAPLFEVSIKQTIEDEPLTVRITPVYPETGTPESSELDEGSSQGHQGSSNSSRKLAAAA